MSAWVRSPGLIAIRLPSATASWITSLPAREVGLDLAPAEAQRCGMVPHKTGPVTLLGVPAAFGGPDFGDVVGVAAQRALRARIQRVVSSQIGIATRPGISQPRMCPSKGFQAGQGRQPQGRIRATLTAVSVPVVGREVRSAGHSTCMMPGDAASIDAGGLLGVMACTPEEASTGAMNPEPQTSKSTGDPSTGTTVTPTTGEPATTDLSTSPTEDSTTTSTTSTTNGGVHHLSDGALVGAPVLTWWTTLHIAPHGVFSLVAATSGKLENRIVHHFVEGQLDWSSKLGFPDIRAIDVSDKGEVAVMARAEDDTHWIALHDARASSRGRPRSSRGRRASGSLQVATRWWSASGTSSACSRSPASRPLKNSSNHTLEARSSGFATGARFCTRGHARHQDASVQHVLPHLAGVEGA